MHGLRDFNTYWKLYSGAFFLARHFARILAEKYDEERTERALQCVIDQGYFEAFDRHGLLRRHWTGPGKVGGPCDDDEAAQALKLAFCMFGDEWPYDCPAAREMVKRQPGYYLSEQRVLALVRIDSCTEREQALTLLDLAHRVCGSPPDAGWSAQRRVMDHVGGTAWARILDMECRAIRGERNGHSSGMPMTNGNGFYYGYLNAAFGHYGNHLRVNPAMTDCRCAFVQRAAHEIVAVDDKGSRVLQQPRHVKRRPRPFFVRA